MPVKLTPRLMTAVPYIRGGRLVADVGTDHAYLPIYLCEQRKLTPVAVGNGETLCAIAADINKGPVERADRHIAEARLTTYIRTVQTDGLTGLDTYDPEDIIIFGMGGELIVSILAAAPWVCRPGKRLILQPMTHAEKLRGYLSEAGFSIIGETLSREGERIYQILCAEPTVNSTPCHPTTNAEEALAALWVGARDLRRDDAEQVALYEALLEKILHSESTARDARRAAGQVTDEADRLLRSLRWALARARAEDAET